MPSFFNVDPSNHVLSTGSPLSLPLHSSPSTCSMNTYDQASESQHIAPPCVDPRRSRSTTAGDTASVSSSSGGGGSDVNSLKTSPGGIVNHHITNGPPVSAPWYQPHIPRELALEILSRQPVSFYLSWLSRSAYGFIEREGI